MAPPEQIVACLGQAVTLTGHTVICVHTVSCWLHTVAVRGQWVKYLGHSVTLRGQIVGVPAVPGQMVGGKNGSGAHIVGDAGHAVSTFGHSVSITLQIVIAAVSSGQPVII